MTALTRKLFRDLWRMRGQAVAISLVIASGVATYVLLMSTMDSLKLMRDSFYREYGFSEVFVSLKRAPENVRARIEEIPGVERAETRVIAEVKLEIAGFDEPVAARLVSLPESGKMPHLNRLHLRKGRLPDPARDYEAVLSEAFAEAQDIEPGETVGAIINGRKRELRIVGVALSPEYVMQVKPGALSPDYKRYSILWMGRETLGKAYDMDGAFNDAVISLGDGVKAEDVITRIDTVLSRYGGLGAYARKDQISHRYLTEEFNQLERSARIFPTIFMAVAAFLLNVVISRTVSMQRDQIGALKAFGYGNRIIGAHYLLMIMLVTLAGITVGLLLGAWLGSKLAGLYMTFYRFPYLMYNLRLPVALAAAAITGAAALFGTLFAVRKAALLPPAEALRPEPPAKYRRTLLEALGYGKALSQPVKMILRNLERNPVKSALSITGIALSCSILVSGVFWADAMDYMLEIQFKRSQQEDMTVTFTKPASWSALYDLEGVEGIERAEPFRAVAATLRFANSSYRTAVRGVAPDMKLQKLLDTDLKQFDVPAHGIVLTDYLGKHLGVRPGDMLTVEVMEGARPVFEAPVVKLVKQYIGVSAYMDIDALNRMVKEGDAISGAYLAIDRSLISGIYKEMMEMPLVAGTSVRADELRNFYETQAQMLIFFTMISTLLAATIAFGVVYNSARIMLSERSRELASLRVLGYTKGEISFIFLGELAVLTILSVPLGFLVGRGICAFIAERISSDLFRVPVVIDTSTYAFAAGAILISAAISGLIVRRRLDRLDLVEVLKARE